MVNFIFFIVENSNKNNNNNRSNFRIKLHQLFSHLERYLPKVPNDSQAKKISIKII